ncbi:hypothetical protein GVAV_001820 [Gurleya vavrai]
MHKIKKITNIESTEINKNYKIDLKIKKNVKIGVLIRKIKPVKDIFYFFKFFHEKSEIKIYNNDDLALNSTIDDIFFNLKISIKYSNKDKISRSTKYCLQEFINSSYMSQISKLLNELNFQKYYYEDETDKNENIKIDENLQNGIKKIFNNYVSVNRKNNKMLTFADNNKKTLDTLKEIVKKVYKSYKNYYKNNFSLELYYFENINKNSYPVDFIKDLLTRNFYCETKENIDLNYEL